MTAPRPRVLLAHVDAVTAAWLGDCLASVAEIRVAHGAEALGELLGQGAQALMTGLPLGDPQLVSLLDAVGGQLPVLIVGQDARAPAPDDERIFFVLSRQLPAADVAALVQSAVAERLLAAEEIESPAAAARLQRVLALSSRFATRNDLASAASVAEDATSQLTRSDRSYCLFHDADSGSVWTESEPAREGRAAMGLVGFAARTRRSCAVERAHEDPHYVAALDDPAGEGRERLLVQPVVGPDGQVQAVLVAVRLANRAPFAPEERELLATFAQKTGPMMHHLALMVETEAVLRAEREQHDRLYRREALRAYGQAGHRGDVVRISPTWIRWAYWVLLGLSVASVVYLCVGRVDQHSAGPAIIRLHARTEITAQSSGALVSVEVAPGERVQADQLLARLDDSEARASVQQLQREFDDQLRRRLLDPADAAAMQSVFTLRGQLASARTVLDQRQLRASRAGIVSDIRIRPGQHITVGEIVLSLLDEADDRHVLALLAGADRPQLHPGMVLRLEIAGYRYAYQDLVIDWISDEVIGPNEVRRYLGPQVGDALVIAGPVVLVRARLPGRSFVADDETYQYHDGMLATAEVAVRAEPIIVTLFPFLKRI